MSDTTTPFIHTFKSITPSQELLDEVIRARVNMVMNAPFFGNIIMSLDLVFVDDEDPFFRTMATDGRTLIINGKFFRSLTTTERLFGLGHELGHVIFNHAGSASRRLDRDPFLWNVAADHIVNNMLVESGIGTMITSNNIKLYCDHKYRSGWSTEMVYNDLLDKAKKQPKSGGAGGDNNAHKTPKDRAGGNQDREGRETLDDHLESGSIQQTGTDADGNATYGVYRDGHTPQTVQEQIQRAARATVIGAAQAMKASKTAGGAPAGVLRELELWSESQIDWRELLATTTSELFRTDYTYSRLSKKTWCTNVILPGFAQDEKVRLAAALDMSGSIGQEEASLFLGELWGIMSMYSNFEIDVWCYDTEVYNHQKFTQDNLDALKEYEVKGGGGTDYDANYNFMKKHDIQPEQFINFTDGYPNGGWGDPDYTDTIFVLTVKSQKPPFGAYAYFENA